MLQEFYVTVTGKLLPGFGPALVAVEMRSLSAWKPVATDQRMFESA